MGKLLLRWLLLALAVIGASLVCRALGLGFQAVTEGTGFLVLMIGAAFLGFLNATLRPILKLLTLPLSCLTLGLFSLVVNAVVLWIAASARLGFEITDSGERGFLTALVASIVISIINGALGILIPEDKDD